MVTAALMAIDHHSFVLETRLHGLCLGKDILSGVGWFKVFSKFMESFFCNRL